MSKKNMDKEFREKIILAIVGGLFVLWAAYINVQGTNKSPNMAAPKNGNHYYNPVANSGNNIVISNGGNATSISSVNIVDQSVAVGNSGIAIGAGSNVNINQNASSNSNVNLQINGQNYSR